MLRSRKLKFLGPMVWDANKGFEGGRSRLYPHGPGSGGGCMAARGEDISMTGFVGCAGFANSRRRSRWCQALLLGQTSVAPRACFVRSVEAEGGSGAMQAISIQL